MKCHLGLRVLAATYTLLLAGGGSALASSPNDTDAWAHLEEMERHGILRDPYWAQAYWARARSAPGEAAKMADLRWALRFDPHHGEARWALVGLLLRARDDEFATQIQLAIRYGVRSFLTQQRALVWIVTIGGGALFGGFVLVALVAIARAVPKVHHGIREKLHFLPVEVRGGASLLTLAVPLGLPLTLPPTAALFWVVLLGTAGAWGMLSRAERETCARALALILLAPLALAVWTRVAEPFLPESYLRFLWITQAADGEVAEDLGCWTPPTARENPDYLATLALIERRAGHYPKAAAHLEHAIHLDPSEWSYHNNLGNAKLLGGNTEGALDSYATALALAPRQALIRVNQAQAWMRKLEFTRADQALAEATRLGFRLPKVIGADSPVVVHDQTLSAAKMWELFVRGDGRHDVLSWRRAAAMVAAPLFPVKPVWISIPLFLALYYVSLARLLPRVHSCAGCGRPLCRKCHYRALRRSLCSDCNLIRQQVRAPLKREALLRERRCRVLRSPRLAGLAVSLVLPGMDHVFRDSPRRALVTVGTALGLLLLATAGRLWPDPAPVLSSRPPGWGTWVPLILYAILAIGSLRSYLVHSRRHDVSAAPPGPFPRIP